MRESKDIKIENDLKQLLIGSLLGDGCFCRSSKRVKNMSFSITHGEKQKDYIEYKHSILKNYNLVPSIHKHCVNSKRYLHPFV